VILNDHLEAALEQAEELVDRFLNKAWQKK
jgi:hypothetical protein